MVAFLRRILAEVVRRLYSRMLGATLRSRPVVLTLWILVTLLAVPLYMFSMKELGPMEDQGVVFGIVQAAPNSTLDQTMLFVSQVNQVYVALPEATNTFQITYPTGGFSGVMTKAWSERERTSQQIQLEVAQGVSKIPGVRVIPLTPPPLPGVGDFPVDFVIASTRGADVLLWLTPPIMVTADVREYQNKIGRIAAQAVRTNRISRVVHLSSYGAHLDAGTGPILGLRDNRTPPARST